MIERAQEHAPSDSFSSVTYIDCEGPESLLTAGSEDYAEQDSKDFTSPSLREACASPAKNRRSQLNHLALVRHHRGRLRARDHGVHAGNMVFMGPVGGMPANLACPGPGAVGYRTCRPDQARRIGKPDWSRRSWC